jgi:predicted GIY-YIG superfamily endonuclease
MSAADWDAGSEAENRERAQRAEGWSVYGLVSESTGRRYTGRTDDLVRRLDEHNDPTHNRGKFTTWHADIVLGTTASNVQHSISVPVILLRAR